MNKLLRFVLSPLLLVLLLIVVQPANAQNNPYADDKRLHFGFSLGMDFLSYGVESMARIAPFIMHEHPT